VLAGLALSTFWARPPVLPPLKKFKFFK
jgi:hypothetical protein